MNFKFLNFTTGWKTYATVAIGIGVAVAQVYGFHIPWAVDVGLGFVGLGFHRLATQKLTTDTVIAINALIQVVQDVQSQVTVPVPTLGQATTTKVYSETTVTDALNSQQLAK